MQLTKMVEVDDARVEALTPEAFRLVLEARGWERYTLNRIDGRESRDAWWPQGVSAVDMPPEFFDGESLAALGAMADAHHNGSTYDAFTEVERVQALLGAVEAAERGEWVAHVHRGGPERRKAEGVAGSAEARVYDHGYMHVIDTRTGKESRLSLWSRWEGAHPDRAAREARAQLPRLVRIICGVEGKR